MNTCNTNIPYFLTANHCFIGDNNVNGWRFTFQAWSPTCDPSQNSDGITFNGAALRSRNAASDFCLLELYNTPPSNSNIHFAGWTKSSTAPSSTIGIHHPRGDVMKISEDNSSPIKSSYLGGSGNNHWQVNWDQGVTEPASSGSPLFDINHHIIGQLHGGYSSCGNSDLRDWYGSFDISWTGGGSDATRLSNWLDPNNSGSISTNTTNVNNLSTYNYGRWSIVGDEEICSGSKNYYLIGVPSGVPVQWSSSNVGLAQVTSNGTSATVTQYGNGNVTITAVIGDQNCSINTTRSKTINVGGPYVGLEIAPYIPYPEGCYETNAFYFFKANYSYGPGGQTSYQWGYRLQGSSNQTIITGTSQTEYFIFSGSGVYEIFVRPVNACGIGYPESVKTITVVDYCPGGGELSVMASPNPVQDILNVTIKERANEREANNDGPVKIELYAFQSNIQSKKWMFAGHQNQFKLNVAGLPKGMYLLKVIKGDKQQTRQILIR